MHCERETGGMQSWVDDNREDFLSRGLEGKEFVATTFVTPDPEIDNVEAPWTRKLPNRLICRGGRLRSTPPWNAWTPGN